MERFVGEEIQVLGDKPDSQKKFSDKNKFPFPLIADNDSKVADAFGAPHLGPIPKGQVFLVKGGKVVWNMLGASTDTHAADVLKAYESLPK